MIYKFKSQAAADLLMMGPQGDQILRLIGKTPGPQGIITVAQLPAAIEALQAAVAADEARLQALAQETAGASEDKGAVPDGDNDVSDDGPPVRLRQRVQPLLAMMRASLAEQRDVVWGV